MLACSEVLASAGIRIPPPRAPPAPAAAAPPAAVAPAAAAEGGAAAAAGAAAAGGAAGEAAPMEGIDPEFLAALPPELQAEVMEQQVGWALIEWLTRWVGACCGAVDVVCQPRVGDRMVMSTQ